MPPPAGQAVFGVARAEGLRVTFGLVSGTGRTFRGPAWAAHRRQPRAHRAAGPGLDRRPAGRRRRAASSAINTLRLGDRFALAQPADAAFQALVARLAAGESPTRRRLGVALAPAHVARRLRRSVGLPERDGLLVRGVEDGSPAAAGRHRGRRPPRGRRRHRPRDGRRPLRRARRRAEDATLTLTVVRGTDERAVEVRFDAPAPADG